MMTIFEKELRIILEQVPAIKSGLVLIHHGVLIISEINSINKFHVVFIQPQQGGELSSFLGQRKEDFQTNLLQANIKMIDIDYLEDYLRVIASKKWANIKCHYQRSEK